LRFTRRIKRTRSGQFELRLSPEEREVLRGLPTQMRDALALGKDDPAVARLNPSACLDDEAVDSEFHEMMDDDLNTGRLEALQAFEKTVDAQRLDEEEALAWLRAVNDVRLLLGTRLDVGEEPEDRRVAPDDPRAPGFALYDYLSLLTQELVEALEA
jgi:cysteinyl-tRNA synthetase